MNPLFPDDIQASPGHPTDGGYLPSESEGGKHGQIANPAADLIRRKIDALYSNEPEAREEAAKVEQIGQHRSRHQQFMYELSTSGKPLAQIQTEWHAYYVNLPDHEKREVWQEFYQTSARRSADFASHQATAMRPPTLPEAQPSSRSSQVIVSQHAMAAHHMPTARPATKHHSVARLKKQVLGKVQANSKAQRKAKQHLQSLVFGLGAGVLAILVLLFSFFNEVIIAPLIQPGGKASATPIILSTDGVAPTAEPQVIIPKISVQLPVVYGLPSIEEDQVQKSLESGVIHYPNTAVPGQQGNAAFFGHSSNNIFNKGKYKFAFVLLHELVPGDIFYLTHNQKVYAYRVYEKKVVDPEDVWILGNAPGKVSTAALITCDPPGTSLRRLVVWGEQISPDPSTNASAPVPTANQPAELPSEGPTLWGRLWNWATPW